MGRAYTVNDANIQKVVESIIHRSKCRPERTEDIFLLVNQKAKSDQLKSFTTPELSEHEIKDFKTALNILGNTGGSRKKYRKKRPKVNLAVAKTHTGNK